MTVRKDVMPILTALPGTSRKGQTDVGSKRKDLRLVMAIMTGFIPTGCGDTLAISI